MLKMFETSEESDISAVGSEPIDLTPMNNNLIDDTPKTECMSERSSECEVPLKRSRFKGKNKIDIEFISNKAKRQSTFSKRKTGLMKKAYELAELTGAEVLLMIASETNHVYTYGTTKMKPVFESERGKMLIEECLNSTTTGVTSSSSIDEQDPCGSPLSSQLTLPPTAGAYHHPLPTQQTSLILPFGSPGQSVTGNTLMNMVTTQCESVKNVYYQPVVAVAPQSQRPPIESGSQQHQQLLVAVPATSVAAARGGSAPPLLKLPPVNSKEGPTLVPVSDSLISIPNNLSRDSE